MHAVLTTCRDALRWVGRRLSRPVNDSPPSDHPPGSNVIPDSDAKGGRVISSGDSGAM